MTKDFQVTFEKYVELLKRVDSIEEWSFNHIRKLEEQIKKRDKALEDMRRTVRFQRHLIHKNVLKTEKTKEEDNGN